MVIANLIRPAALVTGGAHRVGRAIVNDLAHNGWRVAIHFGSSHEEAAKAAAEINRVGGEAVTVGGDLKDEMSPRRSVERKTAQFRALSSESSGPRNLA